MPALTNSIVASAKPAAARYELVDGEGLSLVVMPTGAKIWRLRYRVKTTRERKRIVLGKYPDLSLAKARSEAAGHRGDVQRGRDPAAEQEAARAALRMVDLFGTEADEGWYLSTYVRTAGRLGTAKTEHGIRTDRYRLKHLRSRPKLLQKPVAAVTAVDLDRLKASMSPGTWRQLRAILKVAFKHAKSIGAITTNPMDNVRALPARRVERYLTPAERAALNAALEDAERLGPRVEGGLSPSIVRAFRLLSLTGMRLGEVLGLEWEGVDWTHGTLSVMSKTGEKSVPLTPQARAWLRDEHEKAKAALDVGSPRGVVCADGNRNPLRTDNVERAWRSLRRHAGMRMLDDAEQDAVRAGKRSAPLDDLRIHDLRHSWASDAVSAGVPLYVVGAVLGHRQPSTTARYAHLHDAALRDGLAKAGAAIEAAGGKVAEIRPKRRRNE